MRIIEEVKLDFSDVLIKPKRSTLISRKEAWLASGSRYCKDWDRPWLSMYYSKIDRRWISTTKCHDGVCGCGPRSRRSYHHRRRLHSSGGYSKELWGWCRLCNARWHVGGTH